MNLWEVTVNIIKFIWVPGQHLSKIPCEFFSQTLMIIGSETGSPSPQIYFFFPGGLVQAPNTVEEKIVFVFYYSNFAQLPTCI